MDYYRNRDPYYVSTSVPSMPTYAEPRPYTPSGSVVYSPSSPAFEKNTLVQLPSSPPPSTTPSTPGLGLTLPKTFLQWKAQAKEATAQYKEIGFPSPVAWVYVEGHEVPPNAVIGGIDRKGPWYIARTFYEGSMELGKAGRHFKLGAAIAYNGRDRDVGTYEVLVLAAAPVRWTYQEAPPALVATKPTSVPAPTNNAARLRQFKTVVIVDDSVSMEGKPWEDARDALAGVAEISRQYEADGLDIYFLNDPRYRLDIRDQQTVRSLFDSVLPDGQTPTGTKLQEILDIYIPRIEDRRKQHKPINIIVITDGVPTDDPKEVIVSAAHRLDNNGVPVRQLGIQFVQIGDDKEASAALKELDDDLAGQHAVRDMVDTTLFDPNEPRLRTEVLLKVMVGAIDSIVDNRPSAPGMPQGEWSQPR
ncbi:hypothetical protein BV25DRAFT_1345551 [Artomyces pyxidatus]|uniref:Uncharacterized protein n=1 Tax=Artomyces pyxidatus TaxID=48021 RepID=A0ACB8SNZ9_9AGAM|nr:hypothetical protein BV25DRAFT_1345551 [Artomyces pyxidatus]